MSVLSEFNWSKRGPVVVDASAFKQLSQRLSRRKLGTGASVALKALAESKVIPVEQFPEVLAVFAAELPNADAATIAAHFEPLARQYSDVPPEAFREWVRQLAQLAIDRHDVVGGAEVNPQVALQLESFEDPTDRGIAERLLAANPQVLWVTGAESWFRWDGQVYARCSPVEVQALLLPLADSLAALLPECYRHDFDEGEEVKGEFKAQRCFLRRCKSSGAGAAIVAQAKCLRNAPWSAFDCDEFLVSFSNCVLDLRAGQAYPPHPRFFLTRGIRQPWEQSSAAQSERWGAYLNSLALGPDVLSYMQRLFGYALTGAGTEKAFAWLFGESDSGKSTFAEVLALCFDGYAARVDSSAWMRSRGDSGSGHTDALMPVAGARLVWCDEVKQGSRFDEARMKQATSGCGSMRLSAKGEKGVDVRSRFLLTFTTDVLPSASEGDAGLFNRMRQVRFKQAVVKKRVGFAAALVSECRPAIVGWLLEGSKAWLAGGLGAEPQVLTDARAEYADEQSWLKDELTELYAKPPEKELAAALACTDAPQQALALAGMRTTISAVRKALEDFHRERGVRIEVHARVVGRALRELGYQVRKSDGKHVVEWIKRRMPGIN